MSNCFHYEYADSLRGWQETCYIYQSIAAR